VRAAATRDRSRRVGKIFVLYDETSEILFSVVSRVYVENDEIAIPDLPRSDQNVRVGSLRPPFANRFLVRCRVGQSVTRARMLPDPIAIRVGARARAIAAR